MQRSVFRESWGSTGGGSSSFHIAILVVEGQPSVVDETVRGTNFNWGSKTKNGGFIKLGGSPRKTTFGEKEYERAMSRRNTWSYAGLTDWSDDDVLAVMARHGAWFNIVLKNCRSVSDDTIFSIRLPKSLYSVERAAHAPVRYTHVRDTLGHAEQISSTDDTPLEIRREDGLEYLEMVHHLGEDLDWERTLQLLERCRSSFDTFMPS
ncbi:hypothetical protein ACHAQA_006387, partial [Verticillium albo-atrum]